MLSPALKLVNQGFTLIELLIVISLIAILTGASLPSFSAYIKNQNLRQAQEQLKSDLRTVQTRALVGSGNDGTYKYWGLKIVGDTALTYYFFKSTATSQAQLVNDCNAAVTSSTEQSRQLPGDISVRNGSGNWCFYFSFSSGDVTTIKNGSTGAITSYPISLGSPSSTNTCGYITLNSGGLVTKSALNQTCETTP